MGVQCASAAGKLLRIVRACGGAARKNAAFWQEMCGTRCNYHDIRVTTRRMRKKVGIDGGVFAPEKLWIFCELRKNRYISENLILF